MVRYPFSRFDLLVQTCSNQPNSMAISVGLIRLRRDVILVLLDLGCKIITQVRCRFNVPWKNFRPEFFCFSSEYTGSKCLVRERRFVSTRKSTQCTGQLIFFPALLFFDVYYYCLDYSIFSFVDTLLSVFVSEFHFLNLLQCNFPDPIALIAFTCVVNGTSRFFVVCKRVQFGSLCSIICDVKMTLNHKLYYF